MYSSLHYSNWGTMMVYCMCVCVYDTVCDLITNHYVNWDVICCTRRTASYTRRKNSASPLHCGCTVLLKYNITVQVWLRCSICVSTRKIIIPEFKVHETGIADKVEIIYKTTWFKWCLNSLWVSRDEVMMTACSIVWQHLGRRSEDGQTFLW